MAIIYTPQGNVRLSLYGDIWRYRELFYFLLWRDIKVRYKQTSVGIFWAILQPFLMMLIFTLVFGSLGQAALVGIPYPVYAFSGLIFWNLFSRSITSASESMLANKSLIKNNAFPRIILPFVSILINLLDYFAAFTVLVLLFIFFRIQLPLVGLVMLILPLILTVFLSVGIGAVFAVLNIAYKDVKFLIPFLLQLWLFLTPAIYGGGFVSEQYRIVLAINPLTGIIQIVHNVLLGLPVDITAIMLSLALCVGIGSGGLLFFSIKEKKYLDIL
ncbi:TPA: phosphate ABC transporter permease [Patescibacteria group bacterium]|uniref:Transport permease protein n=1 Tax=Candidatus Gottesmanbacteria bacterium GW2011_GWA1_43_11 TaxID=1618436 RepID=A0A0G1CIZ0_9BACT|nr:MAG: ABC-2 type transporter [Candidatus Gottesmanbacteria bacterium GW2011_GWA1_43_11]HCS78784.1 phosphate ABC transporter permease [Patescibacteria group bacterium]